MSRDQGAPLWRLPAVFAVGLSLAVGWGIRGNFGHEYGAMMAACMAVTASCVLSGRADWRRRVVYFAMFGAMGWGFGGSISYMQVISYTHSGSLPDQVYGFAGLFWIGFLWAAMGGMGAAYPAVTNRERLTSIFRPICWVLVVWTIVTLAESPFVSWYETAIWNQVPESDSAWHRHESPLYWLDADWLNAFSALISVCLFDLWDRRFGKAWAMTALGAAGAFLGWLVQWGVDAAGLTPALVTLLVRPLGDPTAVNPAIGEPFRVESMLTNWPQLFEDLGVHLGWVLGLLIGLGIYFTIWGKWRAESGLVLYMALGWLVFFLVFPVLLGIRMTAPRSDDWAGITGAFAGMMVYTLRNGLVPVAWASLVSGTIGGCGFAGMQLLKLIMLAPGNPNRLKALDLSPEAYQQAIEAWHHWQSANWHSFLEQTYGFVNGLAVLVSLALLSTRVPKVANDDEMASPNPKRRWTEGFAACFVMVLLVYVNAAKNPAVWTSEAYGAVPPLMKAPLFGSIELSAQTWFNITAAVLAAIFIAMTARHLRNPLAFIPGSYVGKGQLLWLAFVCLMVIANFERALPAFSANRLLTEWVITINAAIATVLLLVFTPPDADIAPTEAARFGPLIPRTALIGTAAALGLTLFAGFTVRAVYGPGVFAGHAGSGGKPDLRFGSEANWRLRPVLRGGKHR